jgi:hypothetical protein
MLNMCRVTAMSRGCGHQRFSRLSRGLEIAGKEGIADGLTVDQAKKELTLPEKYKGLRFKLCDPKCGRHVQGTQGTKQVQ